jgi:adenine-specific DNA-methyltransferase
MFFTPPLLADRLIDDLVRAGADPLEHRWADPACGGAAFLVPIAHQMAQRLRGLRRPPRQILAHVETHLRGNDVDPVLIELSRQFLRMTLYAEISASGYEPRWDIGVGDALTCLGLWKTKVDVVACNPPYRKMPAAEVAKYQATYNDVIEGQPNLYALFFKCALDLLSDGGRAGIISPTSFLSGRSFTKLRTHLIAKAHPVQFSVLNERVGIFVGVQQEIAVSVLQRRAPKGLTASSTRVYGYDRGRGFVEFGQVQLARPAAAWPVPRTAMDAEVIRTVGASPYRLSDYGYVPRVGWFVDYRDRSLYPPRRTVPRRQHGKKKYLPLIWSSDISPDGQLVLNRRNDIAHKPVIELPAAHCTGIHVRPAVALQRVTSQDQPRRLVGAPIPPSLLATGVVAENHVIVIEQFDPHKGFTPAEIAALLRTEEVDVYFRCISGAVNVSVFELQHLPLPDPVALRRYLDSGLPMAQAARLAFSVSVSQ